MVSFPPCKINLGLNIIRKRPDGFHDLVTCFYPVPWFDILEIIPSDQFELSSSGLKIDGDASSNLCVRAYNLLKNDFNLSAVKIHLHKIIPMGAGLGGGSSDAAHTLLLLNQIFSLELSAAQLSAYASKLGSDCAFFVEGKPMMGRGRGEVLEKTSLSLEGKFLVIVKPDIHVSTAEAYAGVKPHETKDDLKQILESKPVDEWKDLVKNDFEESVFKKYPELRTIKNTLYKYGASYAAMSGSGSSVFGIFEKAVDVQISSANAIVWSSTLI